MSPDRFKKIEIIYHEALKLPPAERASFINKACGGDDDVRFEVGTLLSFADSSESFIEAPDDIAASLLKTNTREKLIGKRLNHYHILSSLGVGGMGEVYLAEDIKLGRKAALKMLPEHFSKDSERLIRFEKEARATSTLNHPNIVTVYGIEQTDEFDFLAIEFIDGQTLRERILTEPLSLSGILDIGIQVSSALEAAHAVGIIHRDIKPANIMLRRDGYVKVLDFGLAKLINEKDEAVNVDTRDLTNRNRVMGTINYMSPEQALGEAELDARTDIFSFGVVLYEMAAGVQPFNGFSDAAIYDAILNKTPQPITNDKTGPMAVLEDIINRAIEKDRIKRYQTASDLRIALQELKTAISSGLSLEHLKQNAAKTTKTISSEFLIAAGALLILAIAVFLFLNRKNADGSSAIKQISVTQLTDQNGVEFFPSLSADSKSVIYSNRSSGNWDIYLQRVGGTNTVNLTKDSEADDTQAVYSPNNESIAFRSERDGGGIFVMGATGESVKRLTDYGYYPSWSPDEKEIAFCVNNFEEPMNRTMVPSALWAIDTQSGGKRLITQQDAVQPNWSPNGFRIAFWGIDVGGNRDIWTISANGKEPPVQVTKDAFIDWNPVWSPDGKYLYFSSNRSGSMNLSRVMIDEKTGVVSGNPEPVTIPSVYSQHFSFSKDGKHIAYVQINSYTNIVQVGFNPTSETITGQPGEITQGSRVATDPDPSPDGEWLLFDAVGAKQEDIFIIKRDGTGLRQLTNDAYKDRAPRWSPDGKRIAFFSDRTGRYEGWIINADGSNLQQVTQTTSHWAQLPVWSPDGGKLLYNMSADFPVIFDTNKSWFEQTPEAMPKRENNGHWLMAFTWSPDGKKLSCYIRGAELMTSGIVEYDFTTGKYETLTDFGVRPNWLNDNRRLLFIHNDKIYLVDSVTKKTREIMSVAPDRLQSLTVSNDNRSVFYAQQRTEADVWLAAIE